MATFFIENFGCRATDADAVALRRGMLGKGLQPCADAAEADFVVLNTCTVTAAADCQAREAVRKIYRKNRAAKIIVTGCYAQRAPEEIAAIEGVSIVIGNARQQEIPGLVGPLLSLPRAGVRCGDASPSDFFPLSELEQGPMSLSRGPATILTGDIFEQTTVQLAPATLMAGDRTRPILKVQDGCNNRCAYCVIPFVRGRSRSLPPDAVVDEVLGLVAAGAKEIVVSGINLGSYGRDLSPRAQLGAVVRRILDETTIEHLRFSSIEPQDVTEDFVSLVASSDRLAAHFHVPLQSGCDRILRAMHRWYRTELYAERVGVIRRLLPHAAIGADVIVGFPGETEDDFRATVECIERLPCTYLHVFSFSARPGTRAEKLGASVPPQIIRERARELRALSAKKSNTFRASQVGRLLRALTLARSADTWTEALTTNYLKDRVAGRPPANEWRAVVVVEGADQICAEPIGSGSVLENHLGDREIAAVGD
jgi:threonylcarbamoyladenosine tRNA methylthiotransferase MtaB